jgi:hypothetical protein
MWDKQIEEDMKLGKLDYLIAEAKKEFREGKCRQIYDTLPLQGFGCFMLNCLNKFKTWQIKTTTS